MTFTAKSAKGTVMPLLTLGDQNVKSVNHYKCLGIVLDRRFPNQDRRLKVGVSTAFA